jgi:MGT family glycosyltransferase
VLLCDETHFGMGLTREVSGLPLAWLSTSIYFFRSRDTAPLGLGLPPRGSRIGRARNALLYLAADALLLRDLRTAADDMRAGVGLGRLPGGALQNIARPPDLYLMGTVPAFEYPRTDLRPGTHFVGPFTSPADPDFRPPSWWPDLDGNRPVVHVTEGTVNFSQQRLIRPAIDAMADHDALIVATTGGTPVDQLGITPLPDNVRVEPFLPHAHLLPHVEVMVTNGGYGGVQMALANGVPLVVAGATEEKPEVAAHVAHAGVGINLRTLNPTPRQLRRAIDEVLSKPAFRRRALELQRQYRSHNGPQTAARLIAGLLDQRR